VKWWKLLKKDRETCTIEELKKKKRQAIIGSWIALILFYILIAANMYLFIFYFYSMSLLQMLTILSAIAFAIFEFDRRNIQLFIYLRKMAKE